jgi:ubiquinol oxidase
VALWARLLSTSAAAAKEETAASKENTGSTAAAKAEATKAAKEGPASATASPVASSYWGIEASKLASKDGVEWKWSCFRVRIDLSMILLKDRFLSFLLLI